MLGMPRTRRSGSVSVRFDPDAHTVRSEPIGKNESVRNATLLQCAVSSSVSPIWCQYTRVPIVNARVRAPERTVLPEHFSFPRKWDTSVCRPELLLPLTKFIRADFRTISDQLRTWSDRTGSDAKSYSDSVRSSSSTNRSLCVRVDAGAGLSRPKGQEIKCVKK